MPSLSTFESRRYSRAALFTLWAFQVALNLAQVTIVIYVLPWIDSNEIEDMKPVKRCLIIRLPFDLLALLAVFTQIVLYCGNKLSPSTLLQINVALDCYWTIILIIQEFAVWGVLPRALLFTIFEPLFSATMVPFAWASMAYAAYAFHRENRGIFLAESDGSRAEYAPEERQSVSE